MPWPQKILTVGVYVPGRQEALPPSAWHIDGMGKDKHSPFTLLLGVSLSAVPEPDSGNFCVFPGSHKVLFPLLKEQVVLLTCVHCVGRCKTLGRVVGLEVGLSGC